MTGLHIERRESGHIIISYSPKLDEGKLTIFIHFFGCVLLFVDVPCLHQTDVEYEMGIGLNCTSRSFPTSNLSSICLASVYFHVWIHLSVPFGLEKWVISIGEPTKEGWSDSTSEYAGMPLGKIRSFTPFRCLYIIQKIFQVDVSQVPTKSPHAQYIYI